jgi:hypothetical protein
MRLEGKSQHRQVSFFFGLEGIVDFAGSMGEPSLNIPIKWISDQHRFSAQQADRFLPWPTA